MLSVCRPRQPSCLKLTVRLCDSAMQLVHQPVRIVLLHTTPLNSMRWLHHHSMSHIKSALPVTPNTTNLHNLITTYKQSIHTTTSHRFDRHGNNSQSRSQYDNRYQYTRQLDPKYIVITICATNVLIFCAWAQSQQYARHGDRKWLEFMEKNFTLSLNNLYDGRIHTLLTCAFSQIQPAHLLFNVLSVYFLGTPLAYTLGVRRFLMVYIGGALTSSVSHVLYTRYAHSTPTQWMLQQASALRRAVYMTQHRQLSQDEAIRYVKASQPALGASGAAMACSTLFAALYPRTTFLVFFVIPMPAWAAIGGFVAYDLYSTIRTKPNDTVAHVAHLGGAAFGLAYYFLMMRRGRMVRF